MTDEEEAEHVAALKAATGRYNDTAAAHEKAREDAAETVLAALKAGVAPTTVAELSPFTATYVRQMARNADIPPATTRRRPQRPRTRG